jgi:hypothetical protein
LKEKMEKLHDKFHEIQGLCSHWFGARGTKYI